MLLLTTGKQKLRMLLKRSRVSPLRKIKKEMKRQNLSLRSVKKQKQRFKKSLLISPKLFWRKLSSIKKLRMNNSHLFMRVHQI